MAEVREPQARSMREYGRLVAREARGEQVVRGRAQAREPLRHDLRTFGQRQPLREVDAFAPRRWQRRPHQQKEQQEPHRAGRGSPYVIDAARAGGKLPRRPRVTLRDHGPVVMDARTWREVQQEKRLSKQRRRQATVAERAALQRAADHTAVWGSGGAPFTGNDEDDDEDRAAPHTSVSPQPRWVPRWVGTGGSGGVDALPLFGDPCRSGPAAEAEADAEAEAMVTPRSLLRLHRSRRRVSLPDAVQNATGSAAPTPAPAATAAAVAVAALARAVTRQRRWEAAEVARGADAATRQEPPLAVRTTTTTTTTTPGPQRLVGAGETGGEEALGEEESRATISVRNATPTQFVSGGGSGAANKAESAPLGCLSQPCPLPAERATERQIRPGSAGTYVRRFDRDGLAHSDRTMFMRPGSAGGATRVRGIASPEPAPGRSLLALPHDGCRNPGRTRDALLRRARELERRQTVWDRLWHSSHKFIRPLSAPVARKSKTESSA